MAKKTEEQTETAEQRIVKLEEALQVLAQKFEFHTHNRVGEVELREPSALSTGNQTPPSENEQESNAN